MSLGLLQWKMMPLCLIEACQFYFISLSYCFRNQLSFRHLQYLVAATRMRKYLSDFLLISYLKVLCYGICVDKIVSIQFTHPILLLFYRHLWYASFSDFSKMKNVILLSFSLSLIFLVVCLCVSQCYCILLEARKHWTIWETSEVFKQWHNGIFYFCFYPFTSSS